MLSGIVLQIFTYLDKTSDVLKLFTLSKEYYNINPKKFVNNFKHHIFILKHNLKELKYFIKFIKKYKIHKLSLNGNKFINGCYFKYLKNLKALNIDNCYRTKSKQIITDKHFKYFNGLEELSMRGCKQITNNAFRCFRCLKCLDMGFCNQKTITDECLTYLKNLKKISIKGCNQFTIKALDYLKNVQEIEEF